jgi:hypothetical protein
MEIYGLHIPDTKGLTNVDLKLYAAKLGIKKFRGVFMRDTLPSKSHNRECGIVNLNTSTEAGSHWVCYYKNRKERIYFDSFGQVTPIEIQKYLKTKEEYETEKPVIQRNTDIVQHINTHVCGHLCLFVLTSLTREHRSFQDVLNELNDGYTQSDRKTTTT